MGFTIGLTFVTSWEDLYTYTPDELSEEERDKKAQEEFEKVVQLKSEYALVHHN